MRIRFLILLLGLLPVSATAQYTFEDSEVLDHRGQWGLRFEPTVVFVVSSELSGEGEQGRVAPGGGLDLGASFAVGDEGNELSARLRPVFIGEAPGLMLLGGYRSYAGREHWKTFADLDAIVPVVPGPALGVRLGVGVLYDPNRSFGVSLSAGAYAALGWRVVTGFDGALGLHLRF